MDMAMDTQKTIPLIDSHTHILPGIDDGARNEGQAETMFRSLKLQQVEKIFLTPHFSADKMSLETFIERRQKSYDRLCRCPDVDPSLLVMASETLLTSSLFSNEDISTLCIGKKHLLFELPFDTVFTKYVCDQIMRISYQYGLIPILAHVERYAYLMRHYDVLDNLLEEGMLTQVNVGSLEKFSRRRYVLKLLRTDRVFMLGTDCHHPLHRPPELRKWTEYLEKKVGTELVSNLMGNARSIID